MKKDTEELYWLTQAFLTQDFNDVQRKSMAKNGVALPDGSYPIPTKDYLRRAIQAFGRAKDKARAKRHIIRRAQALGATSMLPDGWAVAQEGDMDNAETLAAEEPKQLLTYLALDKFGKPTILDQEGENPTGIMRIKVPFFVGDSISKAPGFKEKIYFPVTQLPSLVQAISDKILDGKQPITVYSRHSHALTADYLPIGAVKGAEVGEDGRTGYALLDILPTDSGGKDAQLLIKNGVLNAVSLRSLAGNFEFEKKKVNDEVMLEMRVKNIDGIDFAPDGPAMPTYGIEVLAAEARVEPYEEVIADPDSDKSTKELNMSEEKTITLEDVKNRHDIVEAIVAPERKKLDAVKEELTALKAEAANVKAETEKKYAAIVAERDAFKADAEKKADELTTVKSERDKLVDAEQAREREALLTEIASKFPEPDKALPVLKEHCKDAKTKDDVSRLAMPVLLEALAEREKVKKETAVKPTADVLKELFLKSIQRGGDGAGIVTAENGGGEALVMSNIKASRKTIGGMVLPEDD